MSTFPTLLLTQTMQPHRVVDWYTSICMQILGKIEVLEVYEDEEAIVRSPSQSFVIPSVARIKSSVGHIKHRVKFSKLNVCVRDNFTCQYCGTKLPMRKLNYDHVVPRSRGGKTNWTNIVCACFPCNGKKADRTPEQAGMKLLKKPSQPKTLPMNAPLLLNLKDIPETWKFYLNAEDMSLTA